MKSSTTVVKTDTRYRNHNELVNQILVYLHSQFTGRYWGNATGAVKTESGHFQRYGLVGSTDIIGFTGQGRAVFLEVKTGSGRLSPQQLIFQQTVLRNGCIHLVLREDYINTLTNSDLPVRTSLRYIP